MGCAALTFALAGCGTSDDDQIRDLFAELGKDPTVICDRATDDFLTYEFSSKKQCLDEATSDKPTPVQVQRLEVSGERAKARIAVRDEDPVNLVLLKRDDHWLVDRSQKQRDRNAGSATSPMPKKLNTQRAETEIEEGLRQQLDVQAVNVSCPEEVPIQAGLTFQCQVRSGQETGRVDVTQQDDQGNIRWNLNKATIRR